MKLVFGLGPIGANIGSRLAELGRDVYGFDLASDRAQQWAEETGAPAGSDPGAIDWPNVDTVIIAVRTADQVVSVIGSIREHCAAQRLTVFVVTTLGVADARRILPSAPTAWRVFEAPVSGGPRGAHDGTMTVFLSGPDCSQDDDRLLTDIAGQVFRMREYGHAAAVKLLNNTLGMYNLVSTAHVLELASRIGVPAKEFLDIIHVSSGHSWMSDNFGDVQDDLLLKDVGLLRQEVPALPTTDLESDVAEQIRRSRALLGSYSENG